MTQRLALALVAALLLPAPLAAQDAPAPEPEDGLSLIERGFGLLWRQFREEAGPQLDNLGRDLAATVERLGPALQDLAAQVDDIRNYQAPERLENGDILIRRRPDAPPRPPLGQTQPAPDAAPEIEI